MSWKTIRGCLYGGMLYLSGASVFAQAVLVTGTVRDINTHQALPHVNIFIQGTRLGTTSNISGRFTLRVPADRSGAVIMFRHIGYEEKAVPLKDLRQTGTVYLQPRVIAYPGLTVVGVPEARPEIESDLPQSYAIIEARQFQIRGFTDAGDLLRTDQSIQVEEELSGKKTIGIRGGNPDEVIVLFNGIKLNNAYDNVFDLSLIDLEDIRRVEIIKGSNTALYGPEAFAGVVNIVPRMQLDYSLRFQQRFGTYRSGNWGLHINPQKLFGQSDRLKLSYSLKRGGLKRIYDAVEPGQGNALTNRSLHHTAILSYRVGKTDSSFMAGDLTGMFLHTSLDYENSRYGQELENTNQLLSLRYLGRFWRFSDFDLSLSYKNLDEQQALNAAEERLDRNIRDRSYYLNLKNQFRLKKLFVLVGYQFQLTDLDYLDRREGRSMIRLGIEASQLQRRHHGVVAIAKLRHHPESLFLQKVDVGLSFRHDIVSDRQLQAQFRRTGIDSLSALQPQPFSTHNWRRTTAKFALEFVGISRFLAMKSFIKFGVNAKFPTLFQQISSPNTLNPVRPIAATLMPEKNRSMEIGIELMRQIDTHPSIYGWAFSAVYFQNHYDNKIKMVGLPLLPISFYENVYNAGISGIEIKPVLYLYRKKVTLEFGLSRYFISEKSAFPFKSDLKRTFTLNVDHAGYSFQLLWFYESDQIGWIPFTGENVKLAQVTLPKFSNLDLHLSKSFEWSKLKFFLNLSGRNLINKGDRIVLQGLALRDRRYYITIGAQY